MIFKSLNISRLWCLGTEKPKALTIYVSTPKSGFCLLYSMQPTKNVRVNAQITPTATIVVSETAAKIYAFWQKISKLGEEFAELNPTDKDLICFVDFENVVKTMFISELESVEISTLEHEKNA